MQIICIFALQIGKTIVQWGLKEMINMDKELRLIVTRNCNYNCYFCHGEGVDKGTNEVFVRESMVGIQLLLQEESL